MKFTTILANQLRRLLPYKLKQMGKKSFGMPASTLHQDWSILSQIGPVDHSHVVFDLGARNGWFFDSWIKWCPQAIVHAFEPEPRAYKQLELRFANNPSVAVSPYGVGEAESVETFNYLPGSEVSSSFLKPNKETWDQLKYSIGHIEQNEIQITTLDSYIETHNIASIFLIKIDIQGYELHALKGGFNTLQLTDYVLVESSIRPLYEGAASFSEVHDFMTEQGFHLMNFRAWHQGNHVLMETDLLFRRNDLMNEINDDQNVDRYYIGG